MRKKIIIILLLIVVMIGVLNYSNYVNAQSAFKIIVAETKANVKSITLLVTATDAESGIKKIILPDGNEVEKDTATYTIIKNGTYTFKAEDNAGNIAEKSITVSNIGNDDADKDNDRNDKDDKDNRNKKDKNNNEDTEKKPEVRNIPQDKFIARWKEHEIISEPEKINNNKYLFKINNLKEIKVKELSPRIYQWNEEKQKWVALATRINGNLVETYEKVNGYVAVFAVKQPSFSDVKSDDWFSGIADRANGFAIIEGYKNKDGNTTLKPNNTITRSEFYAMIARVFGALPKGQTTLYSTLDLKSPNEAEKILSNTEYKVADWAKPYAASLHEKGVIKEIDGYTDLRENITRVEAMAALSKLLNKVENVDNIDLNKFKDVQEIERYEDLSGEKVEIADIISGYEDGRLRPNNSLTRAEAITLIINALEKLGW